MEEGLAAAAASRNYDAIMTAALKVRGRGAGAGAGAGAAGGGGGAGQGPGGRGRGQRPGQGRCISPCLDTVHNPYMHMPTTLAGGTARIRQPDQAPRAAAAKKGRVPARKGFACKPVGLMKARHCTEDSM